MFVPIRRAGYHEPMSAAYHQLLDATLQHLETLKARGVRHLVVSTETLRALSQPAPRISHSSSSSSSSSSPALLAGTVEAGPRTAPVTPRAQVSAPALVPAAATPVPATLAVSPTPRPEVPVLVPDRTAEVPALARNSALPAPATPIADKRTAFAALRERTQVCVLCPHLVASRKTVVFGVGNPDAQLMFVGEAPGVDEDEQGEPFVGRAGELLTKIIQATGLQRGDVFIANILKCRPDTPGQASGNRKPTSEEMATCLPFLHEQIDLIRPQVLVALGATAVEGLLGKTLGITKLRGQWQTYRGIPLMPTYHPAYLLRNQAVTEKRRVWEDMLAVMEKLGLPISARQRNYFLSPGR
jgi:DNA polymerase